MAAPPCRARREMSDSPERCIWSVSRRAGQKADHYKAFLGMMGPMEPYRIDQRVSW